MTAKSPMDRIRVQNGSSTHPCAHLIPIWRTGLKVAKCYSILYIILRWVSGEEPMRLLKCQVIFRPTFEPHLRCKIRVSEIRKLFCGMKFFTFRFFPKSFQNGLSFAHLSRSIFFKNGGRTPSPFTPPQKDMSEPVRLVWYRTDGISRVHKNAWICIENVYGNIQVGSLSCLIWNWSKVYDWKWPNILRCTSR